MLENVFIALYRDGKIRILLDLGKKERVALQRNHGIKLKEVHLSINEQGLLVTLSDSPNFLGLLKKFIIRGMDLGKEK